MNRLLSCSVALGVWFLVTSFAQMCIAGAIKPGDIVVVDELASSLFVVDKSTGDRTVISSASVGAGPAMNFPLELALEAG